MDKKIEVVKFIGKRFNEIPIQDNPVFDTTNYTGEELRVNECLILCKVAEPKHSGVLDGYVVIHVPLRGEIISKGKFWDIESATLFAFHYADFLNNQQPKH